MSRPNRWNAARDAHDAAIRAAATARKPRPVRNVLPMPRVLGWMAWVLAAAAAYRYVPELVPLVLEFI